MWPEALASTLSRTRRRARAIAVARALAVALAVSIIFAIARALGALSVPTSVAASVVIALAAIVMAWRRSPRTGRATAAAIEQRTGVARNLLVTAAELVETPLPVRADVRDVVLRDAAAAASRLDIASLFPARRAAFECVAALALWGALMSVHNGWVARAANIARNVTGAPTVLRVVVTVTPPAYTQRGASTLTDAERLEVLAGSRLHVVADVRGSHVDVAAEGSQRPMAREADGTFVADVVVTGDGLLALQPFGGRGEAGVRRVIALVATPDRAPAARIAVPGKDLFLTPATGKAPVAVEIEASDDLALASLRLTYTKVTGSGENFTFKNGEVALDITRASPTSWRAKASLALATLALEPGDVLVYRAVVNDGLPGREPIESDAFVVEMLRPGEALTEGFAIDDTHDKYALSQQMIIVKTERLIAKKATLSAEAFAEEARTIAAEQKKVRAEFVFMMGGEFEDASSGVGDINEEEEAANESELMAGRLQNNGRRDIINATRFMSDAALLLGNANPVSALPREKQALDALQRAFTRSRYILRVLTPRERIDDARRLSGKLNDAASWRRLVPSSAADPRMAALGAALARVATLAGRPRYGTAEANALADIADAIVRADSTLAGAAQAFTHAAASVAGGTSSAETAGLIDAAAATLASAVRARQPASPRAADADRARLRGALADTLKRGGGR